MFKIIKINLIVFFAILLLIEFYLKFFTNVNTASFFQKVNQNYPVARFKSNIKKKFSREFNFKNPVINKINNYGYVNDLDYNKNDTGVTAVIGDSYIEAFMVPNDKTIFGRLFNNNNIKAYSFGVSGAALPQYLAFSEFALHEFNIDRLIFNIVGNDFDESILKYKSSPGFHYFDQDNNFKKIRIDYKASPIKNLIRYSSLANYLNSNINIKAIIKTKLLKKQYLENESNFSDEKYKLSYKAIDEFLKRLNEINLEKKNITIIIDYIRFLIYEPDTIISDYNFYILKMFNYMEQQANKYGFCTINLKKTFEDDYKVNQKRFDWEFDSHWNEYGHLVAYNEYLEKCR